MAYSYLDEIEKCTKPITVEELSVIMDLSTKVIYSWANRTRDALPRIPNGGARKLTFDPSTLLFYLRQKDPIAAAAQRAS